MAEYPLDSAGTLQWRKTPRGLALQTRDELDVQPRTLKALREHVTLNGHRVDPSGVFEGTGTLKLKATELARWDGTALTSITTLCPFELRYLAETGFPHPRAQTARGDDAPLTDLHTHFAGCPRAETLIEVGLAHEVKLNASLLEELGVRGLSGEVSLRSLDSPHLKRIAAALTLPADRQSTFRDMERAYRLRGPFTKSLSLFPALLDAVAADYAAMGVRYVELSIGDLYRSEWLRAAIDGAARAKDRHGLELRFLTAISRHNDVEWDEDLLTRLEALGGCAELVGVDWMGHETNSTRAFQERITRVAKWAHVNRPGFVTRVHAGENPAFPENVRLACEAVVGCDVTLRIGHALYGSDEALELLRKTRAFVELNLTSNFTLNNLHSTTEVPLTKLLDAGVRCVLGTDGPGLYGTTPRDELRAARLAGLTDAQRDLLSRYEDDHRSLSLRSGERVGERGALFRIPDELPPLSWTPEVEARKKTQRDQRREALKSKLGPLASEVKATRVISIAGAWKQAWANATESSRAKIISVLEELIPALPEDTLLVTGGTSAGVEGEVHRLALRHNRRVLATVVEATDPHDLGPGPTEALLLAATPHEKAPKLYGLMKDLDALCLFFGGGNVVHDELRAAANLRLRYLALADVDGASGRHAALVPHRAFRTAADVLRRLDDRAYFREAFAPFWHPGVNPTVDVVVTRGTEILLIRRHDEAAAEPGQWALPGGFVHTSAERGAPFVFDAEQPLDTAIRELHEEAGLDVSALREKFELLAQVEGGGRDERDSPAAWSRTWLFRVQLDEAHARCAVAGGDDASDARWFSIDALPSRLAFDHAKLLSLALDRAP